MAGGVEFEVIAALFAVAAVAGCFDAIAGGGGLLTVPALLIAGLDPVAAIATNKLQGSAGTLSATVAFARRGLIGWRSALPFAAVAALASVAGALSASSLPAPVLAAMVPVLLIGIAVYFATARRMGDADAHARIPALAFGATVVPAVGFYDGIFGPGAGSFYMVGFVTLLGYGVVRATAHTKLANAASNVGSLALFAATGAVVWPVGLTMAAGAVLGAQIGSRLAIRLGARLIRPLLVVISCLMAVRLLADPANPLRQAAAALLSAG
ncbi:TSUP family transporter [Arenibaculum pallidiluteum]|uniref:TSUP family transporter n=1 Tax=Arenibaculum pallidiluteum TaxID=2812559 RepID=UPI001A96D863|nr:TSUP family transporter [Arenibaculum pallidiluteum]